MAKFTAENKIQAVREYYKHQKCHFDVFRAVIYADYIAFQEEKRF